MLVYFVGMFCPGRLSDFKHTQQYAQDFPLIRRLAECFSVLHTTPNVLTEVSNLGKKLGHDFFGGFQKVVHVLDEHQFASRDAVESAYFKSVGLTDSGLLKIGAQVLVITTDFQLYQLLRSQNRDAVNFNHLRMASWKARPQ